MKLAIVGSRSFFNYDAFKETLEDYLSENKIFPTLVISGGAGGVDSLAALWAKEMSIPITVYKADWNKHGKAAGPLRNTTIVDSADKVVAFWDGISRGTQDSINKAKTSKKLLIIFDTKTHEKITT